jgi:hypothetical protein
VIRRTKESALLYAATALVFFLFALRFWLASMGKALWGDEAVAMAIIRIYSYGQFLVQGSPEASPNPLYYLLDKLSFDLYGAEPQFWWDLRLFNRILPATYWAVAGASVFAWTYRRSMQRLAMRPLWAFVTALGIAVFFHSCSFMNTYAIEDRAYSLWVSLSTLQFLAWLDLLLDAKQRGAWVRYGTFSVLMVLTAAPALGQVALGLLVLLVLQSWESRGRGMKRFAVRGGVLFFLCASLEFLYFRRGNMPYDTGWFTYARYFESLGEVIAKAFHHHSAKGLAITMPLLFVFLPFWRRRERKLLALVAYNIGLLALTFLCFKGAQAKGGMWVSRYVIFLIPSFVAHYLLALALIGRWLGKRIPKGKIKIRNEWLVLGIWALFQVFSLGGKNYVLAPIRDWPKFRERNAYAYNPSGKCRALGGAEFQALDAFNDLCRGIVSSQP